MAITVSIINLKGGVGKSTLTMLLGEFLAFRHSKNVLLVDLDSQANLSYCMLPGFQIEKQEQEHRTTYHLLSAGFESSDLDVRNYITQPPLSVSNVARGLTKGTLDMVVSSPSVAELDENLMKLWEEERPMPQGIRRTLTRALESIWAKYDYILIDCPPGLSLFSSAALIASNYYVSPVIPEPLSLQGVDLVRRRATNLAQEYRTNLAFAGVLLNIVKHYRNTHRVQSEKIYSEWRNYYFPFEYWLPDSERMRKLGEYDPDMDGTWAMGADHKFSTLQEKYAVSYPLANPEEGPLSRQHAEGKRYRLYNRMENVVGEFIERCPS